jgi:hypothetical protein
MTCENFVEMSKVCSKTPLELRKKIMWKGSSCQVWYAKAWKIWPQTLIFKIILIGSSTYIYNKLTNANFNYLKLKSGEKCVTCVKFSHMQRFLYQVSNTNNTFNVLLTPRVSSIVVDFGYIKIFLLYSYTLKRGNFLPIYFEKIPTLLCLNRLKFF